MAESTTFANALRAARRNTTDPDRGGLLTQDRLAVLIGQRLGTVNQPTAQTIGNWERAVSQPSQKDRDMLVALVAVLAACGGLSSPADADRLLTLGGYAPLTAEECATCFTEPPPPHVTASDTPSTFAMPSQEDIDAQQQLLTIHRRTLTHLLRQAAQFGGEVFAPTQTANGIAEARDNIWRTKKTLRDWGISVEDYPNDEEEYIDQRLYEQRYLEAVATKYTYLEPIVEARKDTAEAYSAVLPQLLPYRRHFYEKRIDVASVKPESHAQNTVLSDHEWHQSSIDVTEPMPPLPVSLSVVLTEEPFLILLGEPGSGKTTSLQMIAFSYTPANRILAEQSGATLISYGDFVPVLVSAREWAIQYTGPRPIALPMVITSQVWQLLSDTGCTVSFGVAEQLVDTWLSEGRLLLLLDGLDEVPERMRPSIGPAIRIFARSPIEQRCRVIVTSRIEGYGGLGEPFSEYELLPFTNITEVRNYVIYWLAAFTNVPASQRGHIEQEADAILGEVTDRAELRILATNPLSLQLLISTYTLDKHVALNQTELYTKYVEKVAWKRAERRKGDLQISLDVAIKALETIAWELHMWEVETRASRPLTDTDLAQAIDTKIPGGWGSKGIIDFLREAMGVGQKVPFSFIHQTMREYFVARRLAESWSTMPVETWAYLRPRLHHTAWHVPLLLLAAMLGQRASSDFLRRILKCRSIYEDILHRDLLLVGKCWLSGAKLDVGLEREIMSELLQLYIDELTSGEGWYDKADWPAFRRNVIEPIEEILRYAIEHEQGHIINHVLAIAKYQNIVDVKKFVKYFALAGSYMIYSAIKISKRLLRARSLPDAADGLISLSDAIRVSKLQASAHRRQAAIRAIGNLGIDSSAALATLLDALKEGMEMGNTAVEALGKVGPGGDEIAVVDSLLEARKRHTDATRIRESLGVFGQKSEKVVAYLIDLWKKPGTWPRYTILQALFKSAEISSLALSFVLEQRRQLDDRTSRGSITEDDSDLSEAMNDGATQITSASSQIIDQLLNIMAYDKSEKIRWFAGGIIAQIVGDNPLVQCKELDSEGSIHYKVRDLTEELFAVFLRKPLDIFHHALSILVRCGCARSEYIERLLHVIQQADAWLLAYLFELDLKLYEVEYPQDKYQERVLLVENITGFLRNDDEQGRSVALNSWLEFANRTSEDENPFISRLPLLIQYRKWEILSKAFGIAWDYSEKIYENGSRHTPGRCLPYVLAALASFRLYESLWDLDIDSRKLVEKNIRELLSGLTSRAWTILQDSKHEAIELLSDILAGKDASFTTLENYLAMNTNHDNWRLKISKRSVAAYALVQLTEEHPQAQSILLNCLNSRMGERDRSNPLDDLSRDILLALRHISRPDLNTVATLLDIIAKYKDSEDDWITTGMISTLRNPQPGAIPLLVQSYNSADSRLKADILEALGTVVTPSSDVIGVFQKALRDKDGWVRTIAARELGNLINLNPTVFASLVSSIRNIPAAASAISILAQRTTTIDDGMMRAKLINYAKVLDKTLRSQWLQRRYGVGIAFGIDRVYEALYLVANGLARIEGNKLHDQLPLDMVNNRAYISS